MVRRSTPQKVIDERSFPVRLKIWVPENGFGQDLSKMILWLQDNLPRGDFADHQGGLTGLRETLAFYFRNVTDAQRFLDAFPQAEIADGTTFASYRSPALPFGRRAG
jgi:hypothetical protein